MNEPKNPMSPAQSNPTGPPPPPANSCEAVRPLAAELALGTLAGAERAAALAHLEQCADCRQEVAELSQAADLVLLAGREVDPPVGFEVRLLERMDAGAADRASGSGGSISSLPVRRRFERRVLAIAAAVAILAGGLGVLAGLAAAPRQGPKTAAGSHVGQGPIRQASLVSQVHGNHVGQVMVAPGQPSWVLMDVSDLSGPKWVSCVIVAGSRHMWIGSFQLHDGYGSWAAPVQVDGSAVRSARIESPNGTVLATATF